MGKFYNPINSKISILLLTTMQERRKAKINNKKILLLLPNFSKVHLFISLDLSQGKRRTKSIKSNWTNKFRIRDQGSKMREYQAEIKTSDS